MAGDKVLFAEHERLDLIDADAFQVLVYDYIEELLGALMGKGGGSLSYWGVTFTTGGGSFFVAPDPFQFYWSYASLFKALLPRAWKGRIVTFDPADSSQSTTIDYSAVRTAAVPGGGAVPASITAAYPFLWARPKYVAEDTDARRQWNVAAGAEVAISPRTRTRVRVDFQFAVIDPTADATDPWHAVAKITGWPNVVGADPGDPEITPTPPWDNQDVEMLQGNTVDWFEPAAPLNTMELYRAIGGAATAIEGANSFSNKGLGLINLLSMVRGAFTNIMDGTVDGKHWLDVPSDQMENADMHSLTGLRTLINTNLASLALNTAAIALNTTATHILASGNFQWDGAVDYLPRLLSTNNATAERNGVGDVTVTITDMKGVPGTHSISSIVATPAYVAAEFNNRGIQVEYALGGDQSKFRVITRRGSNGDPLDGSFEFTVTYHKD